MRKENVPYTRSQIEFILENWRGNPELCVKVTGHSSASIKMMLQNAYQRLSGGSKFLGSELYAEVVQDYLEANPMFNKPMSIEKFKALFL